MKTMTRKILLPILTIVVAVVMQSCGLGIANALKKSTDEVNEILEGNQLTNTQTKT